MSIDTLYNLDHLSPEAISRERYDDVGDGEVQLGTVKRAFVGSTFQLWDAATEGSQLVLDTDYELAQKDPYYSSVAGYDIYTAFTILNPAYETGAIYATYGCVGSYVDADTINAIIADAEDLRADLEYLISTSGVTPHRYGLELSNNSGDANNDIDVAAGRCSDSTNAITMILSSGITKRLDASWAAGTNQGGLFAGSEANSTWYPFFLIYDPVNELTDAGFDTSPTAENRPAAYTYYRRIGFVLNNSSGNIAGFVQNGNRIRWKTLISDLDAGSLGTNAVSLTVSIPPSMIAQLMAAACLDTSTTYKSILITALSETDTAPTEQLSTLFCRTVWNATSSDIHVPVNTSSQIRYRSNYNSANFTLKITALGWIDTGI